MNGKAQWIAMLALVALLVSARKWLPWLGRLPGDFTFQRGHLTIFIPLGTSILISIVLSILLALVARR